MKATTLCFITIIGATRGAFIFPSLESPFFLQSNCYPAPDKLGVISGASHTKCHLHNIRIFPACSVSNKRVQQEAIKGITEEESEDTAALLSIRRKVLWNTVLFPSLPVSIANAIDTSSQKISTENQESLSEDPFASFGKSLKSDQLSPIGTSSLPSTQTNKNIDSRQNELDSASSLSLNETMKAKAKMKRIDPRTHG
mmetsp:Transcript_13492/g.19745  ORF Transcript_13492/g.19745 Transcript_13492/m.19745 type:complete len:198 (+) Transcript_13492:105-698(+)